MGAMSRDVNVSDDGWELFDDDEPTIRVGCDLEEVRRALKTASDRLIPIVQRTASGRFKVTQ